MQMRKRGIIAALAAVVVIVALVVTPSILIDGAEKSLADAECGGPEFDAGIDRLSTAAQFPGGMGRARDVATNALQRCIDELEGGCKTLREQSEGVGARAEDIQQLCDREARFLEWTRSRSDLGVNLDGGGCALCAPKPAPVEPGSEPDAATRAKTEAGAKSGVR